jgi:hypothetical protein
MISYTQPDNYGSLDDSEINKWSDVLIAPLNIGSSFRKEEESRGIIIAGFEVHRVMVALDELEPAAGLILVGRRTGRPDQFRLSNRRHQYLIDRLTKRTGGRWIVESPNIFGFEEVTRLIDNEIDLASINDAPVILFPFGPKPLVFSVTYRLATRYGDATWFLYTVPAKRDIEYSEGISDTTWFGPARA